MKIGIIGAGLIGRNLAQKLSNKGHQILIANSRGPHTIEFANNEGIKAVEIQDAASDVDVVIITIPFGKVPELPKNLFSRLDANVPVIETMNFFQPRDGVIEEIENGKTHSVWVQEQIGRPTVKAFNNIPVYSFENLGQPSGTPGRIALPISGDNERWKTIAKELVNDTGFDPYDAGSIADSWRQQPGSPVYCTDLTLKELGPALAKADKEKNKANEALILKELEKLGEEYMKMSATGKFPDNFQDPGINIVRSINGLPLKQ